MSRFDDLNRALNEEFAKQAMGEETLARNIVALREEFTPLLQASSAVVDEYIAEVIAPRTDLVAVLQQREEPTDFRRPTTDPHYSYQVNLIHRSNHPYRSYGSSDWATPGELHIGFSWHPNVALQVRADISNNYDFDKRAVTGLRADFRLRVWGSMPSDPGAVQPQGLSIEQGDLGWERWGTQFTVEGDKNQPQRTADLIGTVLTMATPHVLNHRKIISGERWR